MAQDHTGVEMSLQDGIRALQENQYLLDQSKHKTARNMNTALLEIARALANVERDVETLRNQIQPLLRYIHEEFQDEEHGRNRTPQP